MSTPSADAAARKHRHGLGVLVMLITVGLSATIGVNNGRLFQDVDVLAILAFTAVVMIVLFNALQLRDLAAYREILRRHRLDVVLLNGFTMLGWVGSLAVFRYLEPAIAVSAVVGLSPMATILFSRILRRKTSGSLHSDVAASLGMLIIAVFQGVVILQGKSGVGALSHRDAILGLLCVLANAIANGACGVLIKRFSEDGAKTSQILACRVPLLAILGIGYLVFVHPPLEPIADHPLASTLAILGGFTLIYLVQLALAFTEPVTVVLLSSLTPIATIGLQAFDRRLAFSVVSFVCVLLMFLLVVWSTLRRLRSTG
jgi:drug/metabolite transporter (DMT)-like permease